MDAKDLERAADEKPSHDDKNVEPELWIEETRRVYSHSVRKTEDLQWVSDVLLRPLYNIPD